jgi:hypothetical protein
MSKVALFFAVPFGVLAAFAQPKSYAVGGFGDAWFQNQPSSLGITNGYDPQAQTYTIPGNPAYTVPVNPRFQGRSATPRP